MSFEIECPNCGLIADADKEWIGMEIECPDCMASFILPSDEHGVSEVKSIPEDNIPSMHKKISSFLRNQGVKNGGTVQLQKTAFLPKRDNSDKKAATYFNSESNGKYNLGMTMAKGGMGAIINAKDLNIHRNVAMKVMLNPTGQPNENIVRFIEEAQVTGQLEHPCIVPVHELGIDNDEHVFYTMKMVKGINLDDILKGIKSRNQDFIEKFPLNRLLNIFLKICEGTAFAHSHKVIHRDLKPENIMIGEYGEVLVMDWGVSKILHRSDKEEDVEVDIKTLRTEDDADPMMTMEGAVIGTPFFLSPEQAYGKNSEIDERADIYTLGGILYNILSLKPPKIGAKIADILVKTVQGEILPPVAYNSDEDFLHCPNNKIPQSLSAVAMKALSLNKEERYQTVNEMHDEIESYQSGFATVAEDAGLIRQVWLLFKRHKVEAALISGAFFIIFFLILGFMIKVNYEKNRVEAEKVKAEKARVIAEQQKVLAEEEAKRTKAVSDFITEMLLASDPNRKGRTDIKVIEVIDKMSASIPDRFGDDPETRFKIESTIGQIYRGVGIYDKALIHTNKAEELAKKLSGENHPDYTSTLNSLGILYVKMGEYRKAESSYEKALKIRKDVSGAKHSDCLPILINMGNLYLRTGEYSKAEDYYKEALKIQKELSGENNSYYASTLNSLGSIYKAKGEYTNAEAYCKKALGIFKAISGENDSSYALAINNLGTIYLAMKRYEEAEVLYKDALKTRKEILGEKHPDYADSLHNLGMVYFKMRDYSKAEDHYKRTLEIQKEVLGEKHPYYATTLNNLGNLYNSKGEFNKAEDYYKRSLEIQKEVLGEKHPHYYNGINNMALLYIRMGKVREAEALYLNAMKTYKELFGEKDSRYVGSLNNLGDLYARRGNYVKAQTCYEKIVKILKQVSGKKPAFYIKTLNNLGHLYERSGKLKEAVPLYEEALKIKKETLGEKHPQYVMSLINMGRVYAVMGEFSNAAPYYEQAMGIQKESLGNKHQDYLKVCNYLLRCLIESDNNEKASELIADNNHIKDINLSRCSKLTSLEFLKNCKLESINLSYTAVDDISVLKGMPLKSVYFSRCENLTDLSVFDGMQLESIFLPPKVKRDMGFLRKMSSLKKINNMPADEFWKQLDKRNP